MSLSWDLIKVHKGAVGQCSPGVVLGYMHCCKRDRAHGMVYLGGLGAMGVGHMWVRAEAWHGEYPGWDDAPEAESPFEAVWRAHPRLLAMEEERA